MVKNEGKIIRRCLDSALSIIDAVFVLDTGSTDNTKEEVYKFLEDNKLQGKIRDEKFVNFGESRSKSFTLARDYLREELKWDEKNTYGLLLDGDHVLIVRPVFDKEKMLGEFDHYKIKQKEVSSYFNIRFIRMSEDWICIGKTHEVWTVKNNTHHVGAVVQDKDLLWIDDKCDGGCKLDKFERDERLLLEGLSENIDDELKSRYYFYLGQTYNALKMYKKSNEYYMKRIDMQGWAEEKWFAMIIVIKNYIELNKSGEGEYLPEILSWAKRALEFRPFRCENIYLAAGELIRLKKYDQAMEYIEIGKTICIPPENELLFVDDEMYKYGFALLELKMIESKGETGKKALDLCLQILENIDSKKTNFCIVHMIPHIPLIPLSTKQGFYLSDSPHNLSINFKDGNYDLVVNDNFMNLDENFLQVGFGRKIEEFTNKTGVILFGNLFKTKEGNFGTFKDGVVKEIETTINERIIIDENVFLDSITPWKVNGNVLNENVPVFFKYLSPCLPALKYNNEYILLVSGNIQTDTQLFTLNVFIYTDEKGNYIRHTNPFCLSKANGTAICSFTINNQKNTAVLIYFIFEKNSLHPRLVEFDMEHIC